MQAGPTSAVHGGPEAGSADAAGPVGTITTFYSYKGGTGRTMALANTACVLAERLAPGEKVLVVDWDLEAPGLHRYFPPRLRGSSADLDVGLDAGPGLIDLFIALREQLPDAPPGSAEEAEAAAEQAVAAVDCAAYIGQTEHAAIHILRAGRNDDGGYGRRVNTFSWEQLFQRAPGIYRAFAERLARQYRWVLIDSRTGVTDISGICTSLLPEKLVVVFTPNRQSLTGVRELVQSATAYRRGHDDLRPLLVLPLPSRIEASMEKLRVHWRHGRPEDGITGYQPMFEQLLAGCYDLPACDLGPYFDAVQIQQSPDCAYGEVISVRSGSGDRFSLASSYRVFVDRLTAQVPPWQALATGGVEPSSAPAGEASAVAAAPTSPAGLRSPRPPARPPTQPPTRPPTTASAADPFDAFASEPVFSRSGVDPLADWGVGGSAAGGPRPSPSAATAIAAPRHEPAAPVRERVYLSHASEDRVRVDKVAALLAATGLEVIGLKAGLTPGGRWADQIADALDSADAVVVFWSQAAATSEFVRVEADEGVRRGVLLPVLLDDARPPISFRGLQAADLRRDFDGQLSRLVDDIARIARAGPGDRTVIVPAAAGRPPFQDDPAAATTATASMNAAPAAPLPAPASPAFGGRKLLLAVALLGLGAAVVWGVLAQRSGVPAGVQVNARQPAPPAPAAAAPRMVSVPELTGRTTSLATEVASALYLRLATTDEQGQPHELPRDGLVLEQSLPAGTQVAEGSVLTLKVATQTAAVPSVGGLSLSDALARLRDAGLDLGKVESVEGSGARAGTVVKQTPQAGATVAQGSRINVGVAADPARKRGVPKSGAGDGPAAMAR